MNFNEKHDEICKCILCASLSQLKIKERERSQVPQNTNYLHYGITSQTARDAQRCIILRPRDNEQNAICLPHPHPFTSN